MILHSPWLLAATAVLWPPMPTPRRLKLAFKEPRTHSRDPVALFKSWRNWIDLVRSIAGVYLLTRFAVIADPDTPGGGLKAMMVIAGVICAGMLLQTVRFDGKVHFVAPLFYSSGLTLMLSGYVTGGFALFVGWLFTMAGKNIQLQLPVMLVALAIGGFLLDRNLALIVNCALISIPLLLPVLFRQPLRFIVNPT